jgi:hypothetical protein
MKRTLLEIYALAICFVCVFAIVLNVGQAAYAVVEILKPQATLTRDFETRATRSNDAYWKWMNPTSDKAQPTRPSEDELTKRRLELRTELFDEESSKGQGNLSKAIIYLVCFVVVFAIHWRLAKRLRSEQTSTVA